MFFPLSLSLHHECGRSVSVIGMLGNEETPATTDATVMMMNGVDDDDDRRNVDDERHIMMKCLSLQFAHASSDCQFQWEISFQQINRLVQS